MQQRQLGVTPIRHLDEMGQNSLCALGTVHRDENALEHGKRLAGAAINKPRGLSASRRYRPEAGKPILFPHENPGVDWIEYEI